ncbi:MAG TPA: hypothetical protein VHT91_45090 [Kofleriaceae bacterium]|jgi:hypothetical protein|nr:hypothetical protein [Kofleriaceae bacterium]
MIEGVCERDLVAQPRTNDADHDALFGVCQALAMAHDDEGRRKKETKNRTEAAEHWTRATKIDLWPDPPVRFAWLQLARLDESPRRETFCSAIGALSRSLWCSAGLPLDELATANSCEPIARCEPANGSSSPPTSSVRPPLEGDAMDKAALKIVRSAACQHVVKDGDTLLRALAHTIRGWEAC